MKPYEHPAIVIGGGINGLGVIRNLGKNGVDVYCISEKKDEAMYSKYCKKYFIKSNVEHDAQTLYYVLKKIKKENGSNGVLFPTNDTSALITSNINDELKDPYQIIADNKTIRKLIEKDKFYHSLKLNKVPFPKTIFLKHFGNNKNIIDKNLFPLIIKPSLSQCFYKKFKKKGFIVNTQKELNKYLQIINRYNMDIFLQEIIPGPITNHYFIDGYFDKKSKPLILFARQRLRMWPSLLGNSTVCKSVPISEVIEMKKTIVRYLSNIGFRGIFSAEFKKDSRDNITKLLEVNARSWWYNSFPTHCGVNIIFNAYLDSIGYKIKIKNNYKTNKIMIYPSNDLKWMFNKIFKGEFSFKNWFINIDGKRDWIVFDMDDLRPFFIETFKTIFYSISHLNTFLDICNGDN